MNRAYNHGSQDLLSSLEDHSETTVAGSRAPSGTGEMIRLAARDGKFEELKVLVDKWTGDPVINEEDVIGTTALHSASSNGHPDCVKILLEAGANRELKNHYGQTPMAKAKGDDVKELLRV